jgi:hypothetical protein
LSAFACAKALAELLKARAEGPKRADKARSVLTSEGVSLSVLNC